MNFLVPTTHLGQRSTFCHYPVFTLKAGESTLLFNSSSFLNLIIIVASGF